jgi:hypothetical protein
VAKVFKERYVNFLGDAKDGSGKFVYLSGDDIDKGTGFLIPESKAEGLKKGAKVTVKCTGKSGKNYKVSAVRIDAEPRSGGGGGKGSYGGGGGRKADPAVQQSIVMQHSQTAAIALLGEGADLGEVLKVAMILFAQAYGDGLAEAVAKAADVASTTDIDDDDDDFGDDDLGDEESDDDDDFDDDFDD